MASSTKRRATAAKFAREQTLRERRAKKQEKKENRKQEGTDVADTPTEPLSSATPVLS